MLQISEASSLGLHAMVYMAQREGQRVSTREIAEAIGGSDNHLSKILQRLVKSGLVESVRGPKGGFMLAEPPQDIALLDVYEAIEGKYRKADCLLAEKICQGEGCIFGDTLTKTNEMVYKHLKETSLSQLSGLI